MIDGNWFYIYSDVLQWVLDHKLIILFWCLGSTFLAINNRILFRFDDSPFSRIKNEKIRKWIREDYKYDIKEIPVLKWLSFTWGGWHCSKSCTVLCYYLAIGLYNIWIAISFGLLHLCFFQMFYHVILKRKKR